MSPAELDRLIAEKVMGWQVTFFENINTWEFITEDEIIDQNDFRPSTDIESAWLVVEKLKKDSDFGLFKDCDDSFFTCEFIFSLNEVFIGKADTVPMAICKASLQAVGVEV